MLAEVAGNMGVTYDNMGEYQRALESHQKDLALQRELGNRASEAIALNNIGTAYSGLGAYQKALDAYTAALDINRVARQPVERRHQPEQHCLGLRAIWATASALSEFIRSRSRFFAP